MMKIVGFIVRIKGNINNGDLWKQHMNAVKRNLGISQT